MSNLTIAENARKLAAFLEAHSALPEPTHYDVQWGACVKWLLWDMGDDRLADQKQIANEVIRFLPGTARKSTLGSDSDAWMKYDGEVDGVTWEVVVQRPAVCERVVTGSETVTLKVPDPTVEVPLVEVTETVETVEWVCSPLLAEAVAS